MRHILYISTASNVSEQDVERITATSRRNNLQADITGFLLFNGRNFLQMIEGEQAALLSLMNRLALDPRHSGIVKIVDRPGEARLFPDWAMNWLEPKQGRSQWREELDGILPPRLDPEIRRACLNFAQLG